MDTIEILFIIYLAGILISTIVMSYIFLKGHKGTKDRLTYFVTLVGSFVVSIFWPGILVFWNVSIGLEKMDNNTLG